ncbi:putative phosducin [Aspergillus rambellii]|uniref:Putative phosducin n=1 Tax=Aspergillus rambellii TaxID=308745 RepID=A0A0F8UT97_9EURO|nr:putative phosducin [Aspergillus rambellii]
MSSAQDEFNRLFSHQEKLSSHPEDRDNGSDIDSIPSDHDLDDPPHYSDSEDHNPAMGSRTATYHIPNTRFDANTGPKGVIADAQAFERARKSTFRKTWLAGTGGSGAGVGRSHTSSKSVTDSATLLYNSSSPDGSATDEDEERFMRHWRESRMQELQNQRQRRPSPWRKAYGSVDTVDAVGYLDAIEKVPSDQVVVVCVYDPESAASSLVEDCLRTIAQRQPAVRFIKLHHEIAEMDHIQAPALLAYRNGDVFSTIVDIPQQIPKGRSCTADTLEDLLKT